MILKASQRAGGAQLAARLLNERDNDHVRVAELRGFAADDLHGAFQEAYAVSRGTRCTQYLFSLSLNPPKEAIAGEADFKAAADAAEKTLGLVGQPRVLVIHEKEEGGDDDLPRAARRSPRHVRTVVAGSSSSRPSPSMHAPSRSSPTGPSCSCSTRCRRSAASRRLSRPIA